MQVFVTNCAKDDDVLFPVKLNETERIFHQRFSFVISAVSPYYFTVQSSIWRKKKIREGAKKALLLLARWKRHRGERLSWFTRVFNCVIKHLVSFFLLWFWLRQRGGKSRDASYYLSVLLLVKQLYTLFYYYFPRVYNNLLFLYNDCKKKKKRLVNVLFNRRCARSPFRVLKAYTVQMGLAVDCTTTTITSLYRGLYIYF